jgi:hypothetical protein
MNGEVTVGDWTVSFDTVTRETYLFKGNAIASRGTVSKDSTLQEILNDAVTIILEKIENKEIET